MSLARHLTFNGRYVVRKVPFIIPAGSNESAALEDNGTTRRYNGAAVWGKKYTRHEIGDFLGAFNIVERFEIDLDRNDGLNFRNARSISLWKHQP